MRVCDVIKTKGGRVITIDPEASVSEAIARLVQNNIGSLPVVDSEGYLRGIVSLNDIVTHKGAANATQIATALAGICERRTSVVAPTMN